MEKYTDPSEQLNEQAKIDFEKLYPQKYDYATSVLADPNLPKEEFFDAVGIFNGQPEQPAEGTSTTVHFRVPGLDRSLTVQIFENGRVTASTEGGD